MNLLGNASEGINKWANLSYWLLFQGVSFGLLGIMVWCWSLGKMSQGAGDSNNSGYS